MFDRAGLQIPIDPERQLGWKFSQALAKVGDQLFGGRGIIPRTFGGRLGLGLLIRERARRPIVEIDEVIVVVMGKSMLPEKVERIVEEAAEAESRTRVRRLWGTSAR